MAKKKSEIKRYVKTNENDNTMYVRKFGGCRKSSTKTEFSSIISQPQETRKILNKQSNILS